MLVAPGSRHGSATRVSRATRMYSSPDRELPVRAAAYRRKQGKIAMMSQVGRVIERFPMSVHVTQMKRHSTPMVLHRAGGNRGAPLWQTTGPCCDLSRG